MELIDVVCILCWICFFIFIYICDFVRTYVSSKLQHELDIHTLIDLKLKQESCVIGSKKYHKLNFKISKLEYKLNLYDYYMGAKNEKENN